MNIFSELLFYLCFFFLKALINFKLHVDLLFGLGFVLFEFLLQLVEAIGPFFEVHKNILVGRQFLVIEIELSHESVGGQNPLIGSDLGF